MSRQRVAGTPPLQKLPGEARHSILRFCDARALALLEVASSACRRDIFDARCWQGLAEPGAWLLRPRPSASSFASNAGYQVYWKKFMTSRESARFYSLGGIDEDPEEGDFAPSSAAYSFQEGGRSPGNGGILWQGEAPMLEARGCAACAVDRDGCVVVVGGWDGIEALRSAELFRPSAGAWKRMALLSTARCFGALAFDVAGNAYAIGGGSGPFVGAATTASVEILGYGTGSHPWRAATPMLTPRCGLRTAACPFADGKIYAVGGFAGGRVYLSSAEALDTATQRWLPALSMSVPRTGFGMDWGPNGSLYAACGSADGKGALAALEALDPRDGRGWRRLAPALLPRSFCSAAFGGSGSLYVAGGTAPTVGPLKSVECYDPAADRWRLLPEAAAPTQGQPEGFADGCLAFTWG